MLFTHSHCSKSQTFIDKYFIFYFNLLEVKLLTVHVLCLNDHSDSAGSLDNSNSVGSKDNLNSAGSEDNSNSAVYMHIWRVLTVQVQQIVHT